MRDLAFEIRKGEAVGIIGHNGAGKSTLLKLLSRITEPTEGRITLNGRITSLLEVGTGFHPELTGRENIYLNGAIIGMPAASIRKQFDEIVEFAEVERFLDTPVKRYSSGMYMRLAFAIAAHLRPETLILDEVLAVGDAKFQSKCLGRMETVARSGRTVLFVSHNMAAIRNLCETVIWLDRGRIRQIGPAQKVIDDYGRSYAGSGASEVDLRTLPRAHYVDGGALGTKVIVNGGKPVRHGEPFEFIMEIELRRPVVGMAVGFGFARLDGMRLLSHDSDFDSPRQEYHCTGTIRVSAVIPSLPLQPGHYLLDVGVRAGDSTALDYVPACTRIEVLPGAETPSFICNGETGIRLSARWSLPSNTSPLFRQPRFPLLMSLKNTLFRKAKRLYDALRTKMPQMPSREDKLWRKDISSGLGDSAWVLYGLVCAFKPERCMEIGSALGKSAAHIATALERNQKGKLYAVDPHTASDWNDIGAVASFDAFHANMKKIGVSHRVEVIGNFPPKPQKHGIAPSTFFLSTAITPMRSGAAPPGRGASLPGCPINPLYRVA